MNRIILPTVIISTFEPPTLPRWEREFMESSDYARSQYTQSEAIETMIFTAI
jgi:hypothetical protein